VSSQVYCYYIPFVDYCGVVVYSKKINPMRLKLALNDLVRQEIIKGYPILHEKERGVVSQFEDTVIVTSDGCEITTK